MYILLYGGYHITGPSQQFSPSKKLPSNVNFRESNSNLKNNSHDTVSVISKVAGISSETGKEQKQKKMTTDRHRNKRPMKR
jgi:hypothetical protein